MNPFKIKKKCDAFHHCYMLLSKKHSQNLISTHPILGILFGIIRTPNQFNYISYSLSSFAFRCISVFFYDYHLLDHLSNKLFIQTIHSKAAFIRRKRKALHIQKDSDAIQLKKSSNMSKQMYHCDEK